MKTKVILVGVLAAVTLSLSACTAGTPSGTSTEPGSTASSGTGGDPNRDDCLIGTWKVDVDDMAKKGAALTGMPGASGAGTGDITLVFGDTMKITYANTIEITSTLTGAPLTIKATYSGSATSTDWQARDGVLKGTMPTNDIKVEQVATMGGTVVPLPSTQFSGALNLDEGNLNYQCSGNSMTFTRNPGISWKLTKA
jgi:hypothetical protein